MIVGWNYWTHMFNKDIGLEILYLAEICKYMKLTIFIMILAQLCIES